MRLGIKYQYSPKEIRHLSAVSTEFSLDRVAADFSGEFAVHCVEQQPGGAAAAFAPRRADRPVVVRNFLEPEAVAADQRDTDSLRLKLRRDLRNQQVGGDEQRVRPRRFRTAVRPFPGFGQHPSISARSICM